MWAQGGTQTGPGAHRALLRKKPRAIRAAAARGFASAAFVFRSPTVALDRGRGPGCVTHFSWALPARAVEWTRPPSRHRHAAELQPGSPSAQPGSSSAAWARLPGAEPCGPGLRSGRVPPLPPRLGFSRLSESGLQRNAINCWWRKPLYCCCKHRSSERRRAAAGRTRPLAARSAPPRAVPAASGGHRFPRWELPETADPLQFSYCKRLSCCEMCCFTSQITICYFMLHQNAAAKTKRFLVEVI